MKRILPLLLIVTICLMAGCAGKRANRATASDPKPPQDEMISENGKISECFAIFKFGPASSSCLTNTNQDGLSKAIGTLLSKVKIDTDSPRHLAVLLLQRNGLEFLLSATSAAGDAEAKAVLENMQKQLRTIDGVTPIADCVSTSIKLLGCRNSRLH